MKKENAPLLLLAALIVLLVQAGCHAPPLVIDAEELEFDEEAAEEDRADIEDELRSICSELEIEKARLDLTMKEMECFQVENEISRTVLASRLALAEKRIAVFDGVTRPMLLGELDVELKSLRHEQMDSQEELKQLEMMYSGAELEDKTSEIVLDRGRRQLELAGENLMLMEEKRNTQAGSTLPLERAELIRELEDVRNEIKVAGLLADVALLEIVIEELEHRARIEDLEARKSAIEEELSDLSESNPEDDS